MRKSAMGRWLIRLADTPTWLSIPGIGFKVRGRLVTHGLAFSAVGSNEPAAEALALTCVDSLDLKSFWDVGANIGFYTWLLKSSFPTMRAVLIEASPSNADLVRKTFREKPFLRCGVNRSRSKRFQRLRAYYVSIPRRVQLQRSTMPQNKPSKSSTGEFSQSESQFR